MYELKDLQNVVEIEVKNNDGSITVFKEVWLGVKDALEYGDGDVLAYKTNLSYELLKDYGECSVSNMLDEINKEDKIEVIINPQHDKFYDECE